MSGQREVEERGRGKAAAPVTATAEDEAAADVRERRRLVTTLGAAAGIVGPIIFTVAFVVQGLLRTGEYDPVAETVSALEAGPNGWVQQANFVVFGLLTIAFAVGLHLGVRRSRAGIAGPAILVLSGVGLLLAAALPLREDAAGLTYDPGGHVVAGFTYFLSSGVWLIVMSRRMARDPQWRSVATYALASGITMVGLFLAIGRLVIPEDAPLHPWAGLAQRVALAVLFPCMIVLGLRLLRLVRAEPGRAR